jgi:beta-lactam-binding protein with PASTA domain
MSCSVPTLRHMTLAEARAELASSHCRLSAVHRTRRAPRHHIARVVRQSPRPGTSHSAGDPVDITLR